MEQGPSCRHGLVLKKTRLSQLDLPALDGNTSESIEEMCSSSLMVLKLSCVSKEREARVCLIEDDGSGVFNSAAK